LTDALPPPATSREDLGPDQTRGVDQQVDAVEPAAFIVGHRERRLVPP
jgi:hypothetical protein